MLSLTDSQKLNPQELRKQGREGEGLADGEGFGEHNGQTRVRSITD